MCMPALDRRAYMRGSSTRRVACTDVSPRILLCCDYLQECSPGPGECLLSAELNGAETCVIYEYVSGLTKGSQYFWSSAT